MARKGVKCGAFSSSFCLSRGPQALDWEAFGRLGGPATVLSIQEPEKDHTKQDSGTRNKYSLELALGIASSRDLRTQRRRGMRLSGRVLTAWDMVPRSSSRQTLHSGTHL